MNTCGFPSAPNDEFLIHNGEGNPNAKIPMVVANALTNSPFDIGYSFDIMV